MASGVWFCVNSLFAVAAPTLFVVKSIDCVDTCTWSLIESNRIDLEMS